MFLIRRKGYIKMWIFIDKAMKCSAVLFIIYKIWEPFTFKFFILFFLCVCTHAYMHMCHCRHVSRRQLLVVDSLHPSCESCRLSSSSQALWWASVLPLNHFVSPNPLFLLKSTTSFYIASSLNGKWPYFPVARLPVLPILFWPLLVRSKHGWLSATLLTCPYCMTCSKNPNFVLVSLLHYI